VLYFFRDPVRRVPDGEALVVSPADGRILHVAEVEESKYLKEPCTRITIFLSVMDVHVNRAPLTAQVRERHYRRGKFVHAATGEASENNECNDVVMESSEFGFPLLLRQIAGAAARRIVFLPEPGQLVHRGAKLGMIKFGSRTELFIPTAWVDEVMVKEGDHVRGASTVIARIRGVASKAGPEGAK
jgi:phosphatidylserine decarboxylase